MRPWAIFALNVCLASATWAAVPAVHVGEGKTALNDLGLYGISYELADGEKGQLSNGWSGFFEPKHGIAVNNFGVHSGRESFLLHAPWRDKRDGWVRQTYRLELPEQGSIRLSFYTGMKEDVIEKKLSDGVDFAVFVDGAKLWQHEQRVSAWSPADIDLSGFRGRTVDLSFQVGPGPAHDPNHDFALFAERVLEVKGSGREPLKARSPFSGKVQLDKMTRGFEAPAPLMPPPGVPLLRTDLRLSKGGLFDGWVGWFDGGGKPIEFQLAYGAFIEVNGSRDFKVLDLTQTAQSGGWLREATLQSGSTKIKVSLEFSQAQGSTARLKVRADRPGVSLFGAGDVEAWGGYRKEIKVPYLGEVYYMPLLGAFARVQFDPWHSKATSEEGGLLQYQKRVKADRLPLEETVYYSASPILQAVLPVPGGEASPWRSEMASRVVLDSWEGDFAFNQRRLERLGQLGMGQALFVMHIWQRDGYDNAFPDVLPADSRLGGDDGLKALAAAARNAGMRFSLHENYVDLYENAPSFKKEDVAQDDRGELIKAWFNKYTKVQSLALAPSSMRKIASRYSGEIHRRYQTDAAYLDVNSAVEPGWNTDMRADVPGSGELRYRMEQSRELFKDLRAAHEGPVLGEGNHHWWYSGMLDGVEAQFGQGWSQHAGPGAPLFPDFDLLSILPLQINHSMGYLMRWLPENSGGLTPALVDQLRLQEVVYGHGGFIGVELLGNDSAIWSEMGLMPMVVKAIAAERLTETLYPEANASQTLAEGKPMDRVHLRFSGGLELWANGSSSDWKVKDKVLPPSGWLVMGPKILAYTAKKGRGIVDYARTPDEVFVNTRQMNAGAVTLPKVVPTLKVEKASGAAVDFGLEWSTQEVLPAGMEPFFQLVGAGDDKEVAYPDHGMKRAPDQWSALEKGQTVHWEPKGLTDGDYRLKAGLWFPGKGDRFPILGGDADQRRATVANVKVAKGVLQLEAVNAISPELEGRDRRGPAGLQGLGPLRCEGSVRLKRSGPGEWQVWPFPGSKPTRLSVDARLLEGGKRKATLYHGKDKVKGNAPWVLRPDPKAPYRLRLD